MLREVGDALICILLSNIMARMLQSDYCGEESRGLCTFKCSMCYMANN